MKEFRVVPVGKLTVSSLTHDYLYAPGNKVEAKNVLDAAHKLAPPGNFAPYLVLVFESGKANPRVVSVAPYVGPIAKMVQP